MFGPSVTSGFRVPPKKITGIRAHAKNVRAVFGLVDLPFFPMASFIESLHSCGITYHVGEEDDLPVGVEACCLPERGQIIFTGKTYDLACQDDPRARFTVAHELGHFALSHARSFHRESPTRRVQSFEDSEWQANTFAAEFLMPLDDIRKEGLRNPAQLMARYQVSWTAAETRIRKLTDRGEL